MLADILDISANVIDPFQAESDRKLAKAQIYLQILCSFHKGLSLVAGPWFSLIFRDWLPQVDEWLRDTSGILD